MTRILLGIAFAALFSGAVVGQNAQAPPPAFEIADIHASPRVTNPNMRGGVLRGSRYDVRTASLVDLIAAAYSVDAAKVQSGPAGWILSGLTSPPKPPQIRRRKL